MFNSLSDFLITRSTGRLALAATFLFLLFMALVLPGQSSKAAEYAGDAGSPDQSFLYAPADLYDIAEAYGPEGRTAYIRARFTFDVVFPLAYAFFLATTISWALNRGFPPGNRLRLLNLFPILGMLFDFGENISTSIVLFRYPLETPIFAALAPAMTLVKWFFVGGSFVVLVFGLVAAAVASRRA